MNSEIKELHLSLQARWNDHYESLREKLINKYGYDKFRAIQKKAFELIWK